MDAHHATSDRQSLLLTEAAIAAVMSKSELLDGVLSTLDHWDHVAPVESKPLRDEWRDIIGRRDWKRALDPGERGQQLRQSSPLGKALDAEQRRAIIRACKGRNSNT